MKKLFRRLVIISLGVYLLVCLACALMQRQLLYFPPSFTTEQVDALAKSSGLERWTNAAGQCIGMKRMAPTQPAAGRVLITYGNGSCATGCARYAGAIQQVAPFDVFILEYPGYADRPGAPSQKSIFRAADEAFQLAAKNGPVCLLGESLGTGVAAYLAGTYTDKVAGVTLLAPYNRLADVAQYHMPYIPVRLMLVERFPSEDYLRNYDGPLLIFVGGRDNVVPEKFGRRLYDGYAGPKQLLEIPHADHGTIMERSADEWKEIVAFWQSKQRWHLISTQ